jgi:hypothetical protein
MRQGLFFAEPNEIFKHFLALVLTILMTRASLILSKRDDFGIMPQAIR